MRRAGRSPTYLARGGVGEGLEYIMDKNVTNMQSPTTQQILFTINIQMQVMYRNSNLSLDNIM